MLNSGMDALRRRVCLVRAPDRYQIIDKRGAVIVLKAIIRDMMDSDQASKTSASAVEHGGNLSIKCDLPGAAATVAGRSDGERRRSAESTEGGFLPDQEGCDGEIDSPARDGASGKNRPEEDGGVISPRKRQRLRNLRVAKGMDKAREKDIEVVGCWIPSVP